MLLLPYWFQSIFQHYTTFQHHKTGCCHHDSDLNPHSEPSSRNRWQKIRYMRKRPPKEWVAWSGASALLPAPPLPMSHDALLIIKSQIK